MRACARVVKRSNTRADARIRKPLHACFRFRARERNNGMRRAEFLLPPVPSFESGGRGKFIGMLLLFIACLSIFDLFVFFYLIIGKKFALVRHTTTNPFFPEKNSFLDRSIYEYIQNYFQSTALTIKSSSIRFTFSQTLNLPLRFKITSKILESTTNTNHLQTVRKKNFFSSSL